MNEQSLKQLTDGIQPDDQFIMDLEQTLKAKHAEQYHQRKNTVNWRWLVASITVASLGFLLLLPPTQTLATEIFQFFFPTADDVVQYDESNRIEYPETIEVATIAEAEAIAGFDIYEWTDETFQLQQIYAGDGAVTLVYEKMDGHRHILHVNQTRLGLVPPSPFDAVPTDVPIQEVIVDGFSGEYVEGYWVNFGEPDDGEFEWVDNYFRRLHWANDTFQFRLMFNSDLANSAPDAVTIAESLVQRD